MGIEIERFVCTVDEELICTLCQDVFEIPTQTPDCDHIFCQKCIQKWLQERPSCPIDRTPVTLRQLQPAPRIVRNMVDKLLVKCIFLQHGCTETFALSVFEQGMESDHNCIAALRANMDELNQTLEKEVLERQALQAQLLELGEQFQGFLARFDVQRSQAPLREPDPIPLERLPRSFSSRAEQAISHPLEQHLSELRQAIEEMSERTSNARARLGTRNPDSPISSTQGSPPDNNAASPSNVSPSSAQVSSRPGSAYVGFGHMDSDGSEGEATTAAINQMSDLRLYDMGLLENNWRYIPRNQLTLSGHDVEEDDDEDYEDVDGDPRPHQFASDNDDFEHSDGDEDEQEDGPISDSVEDEYDNEVGPREELDELEERIARFSQDVDAMGTAASELLQRLQAESLLDEGFDSRYFTLTADMRQRATRIAEEKGIPSMVVEEMLRTLLVMRATFQDCPTVEWLEDLLSPLDIPGLLSAFEDEGLITIVGNQVFIED